MKISTDSGFDLDIEKSLPEGKPLAASSNREQQLEWAVESQQKITALLQYSHQIEHRFSSLLSEDNLFKANLSSSPGMKASLQKLLQDLENYCKELEKLKLRFCALEEKIRNKPS